MGFDPDGRFFWIELSEMANGADLLAQPATRTPFSVNFKNHVTLLSSAEATTPWKWRKLLMC